MSKYILSIINAYRKNYSWTASSWINSRWQVLSPKLWPLVFQLLPVLNYFLTFWFRRIFKAIVALETAGDAQMMMATSLKAVRRQDRASINRFVWVSPPFSSDVVHMLSAAPPTATNFQLYEVPMIKMVMTFSACSVQLIEMEVAQEISSHLV